MSAVNRIKREVLTGDSYSALCLSFMATALFYGVSEAIFNRLSLMWLVLLMIIMKRPPTVTTARSQSSEPGVHY